MMPTPPTWDDLATTTWDSFYTWDDPMRDVRLDAAYAMGTVTSDGPAVAVAWADAGDVVDGLYTTFARDTFIRPAVVDAWGVSTSGDTWITSHPEFDTNGSIGTVLQVPFNFQTAFMTTPVLDFDVAVKFQNPNLATAGPTTVYTLGRVQDSNNLLRFGLVFNTDKSLSWVIESMLAGTPTTLASGSVVGMQHDVNAIYWVRGQGYGSKLRVKTWQDGIATVDEWNGSGIDLVWRGTPGGVGVGVLFSGTPSPGSIRVSEFFSGVNDVLTANRVSTGVSLDDGLPSGATNTNNLGVPEATSDLGAPIGVAPDVFWSTFRTDQPYSDLDRDIAGVGISSAVVSPDGVRSVRLFTGQMADIPTSSQSAKLKAISRTRLRLSTRVQPPAVHAFYEGAEATWAIQYALFKSGVYSAPPPLPGCRVYIPFSGSTHPFIPDTNGGAFSVGFVSWSGVSNSGFRGQSAFIDGPFPGSAAPDLCVNEQATRSLNTLESNFRFAPGDPWLTPASNTGRLEFWVKGDPTNRAASFDPGGGTLARILLSSSTVANLNVSLFVDADRRIRGTIGDSVSAFAYGRGLVLPADGRWHYIAMAYNLDTSYLRFYMDGRGETQVSTSVALVSSANLPATDVIDKGYVGAQLPIAEMRLTTGIYAHPSRSPWTDQVPFIPGVIKRRSFLTMSSVAEPSPREAYEYISSFAQAELAKTGFDSEDRFQYLPMPYWAEPNQQTQAESLATDVNLGPDFTPARSVNRIYNQVVVSYKDSTVQELFVPIFQSSELITIPHGTDLRVQVSLSPNPVEVRGLAVTVMSGAALAATPPNPYSALNYVTANSAPDGSGTYATAANLMVTIVEWNPGSATVLFRNTSGMTMWTVNNVSLPPFGLAGKALSSVDATVTAEDSASIVQRGTRMLPASLPAIQNRADALAIAQELVARLARPRVTFTSSVFGDPRRAPGSVVSVSDPNRTQVNGQFRLTGVTSSQEGPEIRQSIAGDEHWPIAVWGLTKWGEGIWGP